MPSVATRPREFVRVAGPDAEDFLQRMVSNDVAANGDCDALLLTPKARIIAPLRILRRGPEDFLVMTEPGLGETVRTQLLRSRFAAKVEIEPEEHQSWLVIGEGEVLDQRPEGEEASDEDVERWRIESGLPLWGNELDETILPAEAGLDQTHISFTKGCYPGQEPIARQHYRGKVNRRLRVLEIEGEEVPAKDTELVRDGKVVGRITSAVRGLALGYVRVDVPPDEALLLKGSTARARPR